jgi:hypothetical protein
MRAARREQQGVDIAASLAFWRANTAAPTPLVDESEAMLRRHRKECEDDEAEAID